MNHIICSIGLLAFVAALAVASQPASALPPVGTWKEHTVYQFNGLGKPSKQAAKVQMLSENWNGMTELAYMTYMPDKHKVLLHFRRRNGSEPGTYQIESTDFGQTWSTPRFVQTDANGASVAPASMGLTYLGKGKLVSTAEHIGFSDDYGKTWGGWTTMPNGVDGKPMYAWDPLLADIDPNTGELVRLADTRYKEIGTYGVEPFDCQSCIRFSTDGGKTWGKEIEPPQWLGCNECVLVRAKNGDIVAVLRPNFRGRYRQLYHDNYCGLAVSVSKDNGYTWSERQVLFDYGRMHSSPVLMPNGDIVITYLVRRGYPNTPDGNWPQYGVEAVVSHDNGQTWDLDHRYILYEWTSAISSRDPYTSMSTGCNCTSIVLPDGSILTGAGVGPRLDPTKRDTTPRDIVLVKWKPGHGSVSKSTKIADAPYDSDLRNKLDINKFIKATPPATRKNVATLAHGAVVTSSKSSWEDPSFVLHDSYVYPEGVSFETIPAWIEINWPKAQRIDRIDIYPGDPSAYLNPSNETVPVEYRLQALRYGQWVDIVPRVFNAQRFEDYLKTHTRQDEFVYEHKFAPIKTTAVRLFVTKSSDSGKRVSSPDKVITPPDKRVTVIRSFEVYQAK